MHGSGSALLKFNLDGDEWPIGLFSVRLLPSNSVSVIAFRPPRAISLIHRIVVPCPTHRDLLNSLSDFFLSILTSVLPFTSYLRVEAEERTPNCHRSVLGMLGGKIHKLNSVRWARDQTVTRTSVADRSLKESQISVHTTDIQDRHHLTLRVLSSPSPPLFLPFLAPMDSNPMLT